MLPMIVGFGVGVWFATNYNCEEYIKKIENVIDDVAKKKK
jgi:hypothetical protein